MTSKAGGHQAAPAVLRVALSSACQTYSLSADAACGLLLPNPEDDGRLAPKGVALCLHDPMERDLRGLPYLVHEDGLAEAHLCCLGPRWAASGGVRGVLTSGDSVPGASLSLRCAS